MSDAVLFVNVGVTTVHTSRLSCSTSRCR